MIVPKPSLFRDVKRQWALDPPSYYLLPLWRQIMSVTDRGVPDPEIKIGRAMARYLMLLTFIPALLALTSCADYTYNRGCNPPLGFLYKCK